MPYYGLLNVFDLLHAKIITELPFFVLVDMFHLCNILQCFNNNQNNTLLLQALLRYLFSAVDLTFQCQHQYGVPLALQIHPLLLQGLIISLVPKKLNLDLVKQ